MKNLKVGTKLVLGFGIVVVCLVVIAITVLISNNQARANVNKVEDNSHLQELRTEMAERFWQARFEAQVLYLTLDENAYGQVNSCLSDTYAKLNDMRTAIVQAAHLAEFTDDVDALESEFKKWQSAIDKVNGSNNRLMTASAMAAVQQELLVAAADSAYLNQQSLWRNESANAELSYENKIRRADRLDTTIVFLKDIEAIVTRGSYVFNTYDDTDAPALSDEIDRVLNELQSYIDSAQNQGTKDAAQATINALAPYKEAFLQFCEANTENDADISAAKQQGSAAAAKAEALSSSLSAVVENAMGDTLSASTFALVISIAITVFAILLSAFVAMVLIRAITRPLNRMREALVRVGTEGDVILTKEQYDSLKADSANKDEVGLCADACFKLIRRMFFLSDQITKLSDGDLTIEVKAASDRDGIGNAMQRMVSSLNVMFGDIAASTGQVSGGAKQIADGAQTLAQGSTQQAAAVEELSSSISTIAHKTKENSDMANKAANLSEAIKRSAQKGSEQMENMMEAVREINEASHSIGKVIKVIDDIAFQTNILALNAAVEAARAGQHGKGFAVVAEEVRSLAAKSAGAAKDTSSLIANSIEKAELGAQMAGETSASLTEIVAGINESAQIIEDIARSSEEQSLGIAQINQGIDQVAQVVQQNSATAEESAAASEQMSGQSRMLQELIMHFKLKDSTAHSALPGLPGLPDGNRGN